MHAGCLLLAGMPLPSRKVMLSPFVKAGKPYQHSVGLCSKRLSHGEHILLDQRIVQVSRQLFSTIFCTATGSHPSQNQLAAKNAPQERRSPCKPRT